MYTDEEICTMYRSADDKQDKLQLLHELTLLSKEKLISILNKYGYEAKIPAKKRKYKSNVTKEKFMEYYNLGWTDEKIAKAFGVAASTINYWRNKFGLDSNYRKK